MAQKQEGGVLLALSQGEELLPQFPRGLVSRPHDITRHQLVANQNSKLLQRIDTDYASNTFALDHAATLDLATGMTPSGALKQDDGVHQVNVWPDNSPILALPDATSTLAFVTLRGGGLFVVNPRITPMEIVAEYTRSAIQPAGLLAVQ
jgi:hypothetical protein